MDKHKTMFGVVQYADEAEVTVPFNEKDKKDDVIKAVEKVSII